MTDQMMLLPESALKKAKALARQTGHIAPPGLGPEGEKCGTCEHMTRVQTGKIYLKCGLNRSVWTGSEKTDVRAGDPACVKWEKLTCQTTIDRK